MKKDVLKKIFNVIGWIEFILGLIKSVFNHKSTNPEN